MSDDQRRQGQSADALDGEIERLLAVSQKPARRTVALNYARRLYDDLRAACEAADSKAKAIDVQLVKENLRRAAAAAGSKPGGVTGWFTGAQLETAWSSLHAAEERLLLIQSPDVVRRRLPGINTALRNTLKPEDPRLAVYTKRLADIQKEPGDHLIDAAREKIMGVLRDINTASDAAHGNVRAERNTVVEIGVVTFALLVIVSVINALSPRFIDLTAAGAGQGPKTWWIIVMGLLGGVIGSLATKYRVRGAASDDNSLPAAQAFIRIPMGGAVALGAVILIQSGFVSSFKAQTSLALVGIAFVVGYTPDLVLKYLDRKLNQVTGEARSKDDPERPELSKPEETGPKPVQQVV